MFFTLHDFDAQPYLCMNCMCLGTTFQLVGLLREGHGSPTSAECLQWFRDFWINWAGWPKDLRCDRGTHNRGIFAQELARNGIVPSHAPLETPEQIGRVERHGKTWKKIAKKVITKKKMVGVTAMKALNMKTVTKLLAQDSTRHDKQNGKHGTSSMPEF